jgi:dUTP pyrophosphatase
MTEVKIKVKEEEYIPTYATTNSAGADLRACLANELLLAPGEVALIPTGIFIELPEGHEAQIRPRSGLALTHGITVLNTPGTIDADYRGEIGVILINHGKENFMIKPKMRIAQLVITPVLRAKFIKKEELVASIRGYGGFGSSGTN